MFWHLEQYGDSPACILPDRSVITYAELAKRADTFAATLGTGRKLVFLLVNNHPDALSAYLGCLRRGHVPLLLADKTDQRLLTLLLERYRPYAVYAPSENGYALHVEPSGDTRMPLHEDLTLLLSTSGSTGSPKLVRLSKRNLVANADSIVQYLHLDSSEKAITILPMNYTYGLSVIHSHLLCGATVLLTADTVIQREFWTFFREAGGTSLSGVPFTYEMFKRLGLFRGKLQLPSLHTLTQAGGRLAAEEVAKIAAWSAGQNIRFFVMYGQTEATARMSYLPPEMALQKSASVGIAVPGGRFEIRDADGKTIMTPDTDGELFYYGENVSLGYAENRNDLQLGNQNNGCLATGDVAHYDADGCFYITGRLKRYGRTEKKRNCSVSEKNFTNWRFRSVSPCGEMITLLIREDIYRRI